MLRSKDIKAVLSTIPQGTTMQLGDIQLLVKQSYQLGKQDWEPHTQTRPTRYPRWLHRVQAVLEEYKNKGIVTHCAATQSYTF
jgi:hypothetical protein